MLIRPQPDSRSWSFDPLLSRQTPPDPARSAMMAKVRRERTSAEEAVSLLCRELGLRYRRNVRSLPGSPDLANKHRKWAIFVNGCYWHHHTNCKRASIPKRNPQFWAAKFELNRGRDAKNVRALRKMGYRVLIVWQCSLTKRQTILRQLSALVR
jgi:DNA mismatch endonuclease (patch repair protein)